MQESSFERKGIHLFWVRSRNLSSLVPCLLFLLHPIYADGSGIIIHLHSLDCLDRAETKLSYNH